MLLPEHSVIDTARLFMRPPVDTDLDAWMRIRTDPEVARYLGPPVAEREEVAADLCRARERHDADGFGLLMMVRKSDGRIIGRSGFLVWDTRTWSPTTLMDAGSEHAEVEAGWALARDCWGFGYATEAARACHAYGFETLGLLRIAAVIQHGNQRSIAVARRLGMRHERDMTTGNGFEVQIWIARTPLAHSLPSG